MKLTFYGGAKAVTVANYLLEHDGLKILVDCGMFQGLEFVDDINYQDFHYDPKEIDFLFLTHGHIDHMGRVPKLIKHGFKGKIIATEPTVALAQLSLRDSVHIIAEEARRLGKEPFYKMADVKATNKYFVGHNYGDVIDLKGKGKVEIFSAGHVLGSSMFRFTLGKKVITFTGDLGNSPAPLIGPPDKIGKTDYLLIESAYGDRKHDPANIGAKLLQEVIKETIGRKGVLMIPSFALERTQILLYNINNMVESGDIPKIPVFVDSPLAIRITKVYKQFEHYFNEEVKARIKTGDQIFDFPGLKMTQSVEESKAIMKMAK